MNDIYEKIDDYISGNLSAEEVKTFEQQLTTDRALAEDYHLLKEIRTVIPSFEQLKKQENEFLESLKPNLPFWGYKRLLQLAAVFLIGGASYWCFRNLPSVKNETEPVIEQQNGISPIEKDTITNSKIASITTIINEISTPSFGTAGVEEEQQILNTTQNAFETQKYLLAAEQLRKYLEIHPNNVEAQYYQAVALSKTQDFVTAKTTFEKLVNTEQTHYYGEYARWQLVHIHEQLNEKEEAIVRIEQIAQLANARWQNNARQLLKR